MNALYMLDTNICVYIKKKKPPEVLARFERLIPGQVVISVVTYGELCFGANLSPERSRSFAKLNEVLEVIQVESLTPTVALVYGDLRAALEKQGRVIGANDLWIGAHALTLNLTLVTNNEQEFRSIAGLKVENWTA